MFTELYKPQSVFIKYLKDTYPDHPEISAANLANKIKSGTIASWQAWDDSPPLVDVRKYELDNGLIVVDNAPIPQIDFSSRDFLNLFISSFDELRKGYQTALAEAEELNREKNSLDVAFTRFREDFTLLHEEHTQSLLQIIQLEQALQEVRTSLAQAQASSDQLTLQCEAEQSKSAKLQTSLTEQGKEKNELEKTCRDLQEQLTTLKHELSKHEIKLESTEAELKGYRQKYEDLLPVKQEYTQLAGQHSELSARLQKAASDAAHFQRKYEEEKDSDLKKLIALSLRNFQAEGIPLGSNPL